MIVALKSKISTWATSGFRPVDVGRWEWFFLRLFFAVLMIFVAMDGRAFAIDSQKHPNGLARFFDLTWLSQPLPWESPFGMPGLWDVFFLLVVVLSIFYVIGRGLWLVLPLLVVVFTLPHTLQNSQGFILHKFQIVTLTALAQAIVANYAKWRRPVSPEKLRSWFLYFSQGMIAATYVTSVVSKVVNSKGLWLWKTGYMAVDQQKARAQEFYRTLNEDFAGVDPIAQWMAEHPWLTRGLFGTGFFLEIAALLALHSRKWALLIGLAIIAMHRSIAAVMNLDFLNHELVVLIFFVNVPFWAAWIITRNKQPSLG